MPIFCEAEKTIFTFTYKTGEPSTLVLGKSVADELPRFVGDVHAWVQTQYDGIRAGEERYAKYINAVKKRGGKLSRRAIGDTIRFIATMLVSSDVDDSEL